MIGSATGRGVHGSDEPKLTIQFRAHSSAGEHGDAVRANSNGRGVTMKYAALAATLLVASTTVASAHDYGYGTSGIDARRAWEQRRINNGLRSGQLTWREYRYLEREQARIARDERRAKADGYVSPAERYRLNRELDQASRDIHRLKHNDRVAW
jgi:hypothetical protein